MRKLFVNGKIRTIDKDNHLVTAFAVEDGKFIAVGTEEEVRKAAGDSTQRRRGRPQSS